mgnify:CR=1 FL=1
MKILQDRRIKWRPDVSKELQKGLKMKLHEEYRLDGQWLHKIANNGLKWFVSQPSHCQTRTNHDDFAHLGLEKIIESIHRDCGHFNEWSNYILQFDVVYTFLVCHCNMRSTNVLRLVGIFL